MIVTHIGILIYPVKDSTERGLFFFNKNLQKKKKMGIPNKLNWSITIGILLYCILRYY